MKKNIGYAIVAMGLALCLVLASCRPAEVGPEEEEKVGEEVKQEMEAETQKEEAEVEGRQEEVVPEAPEYGGWLTLALSADIQGGWDPVYGVSYGHLTPVTLALMRGDFWKGPAGTNEVDWRYTVQQPFEYMTKGLAQSFEIIDNKTVIAHLNKGVKWHNKPPVNGREVTADDIAWSYNRMMKIPESGLPGYAQVLGGITFTAVDRDTFKMQFGKPDLRTAFTLLDWYRHAPREVIETYGSQEDWKHVVGNGPFILKDYVSGSSIVYERNPEYWERDPQGRPLPYVDGMICLIIPDASTRYAALRTGKIDVLEFVPWRNAEELLSSNPELKTTGGFPYSPRNLLMMCDTEPFNDVRVRRALTMAIDRKAIVEGYYQGNSYLWVSTMAPPGHPMHWTVDELPESAKELYEYSPEKAKQLLTEAGYPNGFKTVIDTSNVSNYADMASLVKDYWEKIGVEAEVVTHELPILSSLTFGRKLQGVSINPYSGTISWGNWSWVWQPGTRWNFARIKDEHLTDLFLQVTQDYVDMDTWIKRWREIALYCVDQAYEVELPGPNVYTLWQPWVKNYHGEYSMGRTDYRGYAAYVWLDLNMKEEMIGQR